MPSYKSGFADIRPPEFSSNRLSAHRLLSASWKAARATQIVTSGTTEANRLTAKFDDIGGTARQYRPQRCDRAWRNLVPIAIMELARSRGP